MNALALTSRPRPVPSNAAGGLPRDAGDERGTGAFHGYCDACGASTALDDCFCERCGAELPAHRGWWKVVVAVIAAVLVAGLLVVLGVTAGSGEGRSQVATGVADAGDVCDADGDSVQDEGQEEVTP